MDRAAHLVAEDAIDEAMLLDTAQPGEGVGHDGGPKMVPAAGEVLDLRSGGGYGGLDPLLELVCARHPQSVATWMPATR